MIVLGMSKTEKGIKKQIAGYYMTQPDAIEIDSKDVVFFNGRKTKIQVDKYKGTYVAAFVK